VATLLIGKWVGEFDKEQAQRVLNGEAPFDEETMLDDEDAPQLAERALPGHERPADATPAGAGAR
jgi:aerobic C4-dicarboxylate transport protein